MHATFSCDIADSRSPTDRKSTRLNSSHANISYAVFCLKKKNSYGKYVRVTNNNDNETAYVHMSAFARGFEPGKTVRQGQVICFFFFNDTATTEIYTLSLHDALPI